MCFSARGEDLYCSKVHFVLSKPHPSQSKFKFKSSSSNFFFVNLVICAAIAIKESAKVGDQSQRRLGKGVDDLDFFIGDEAVEKPNYACKVSSGLLAD